MRESALGELLWKAFNYGGLLHEFGDVHFDYFHFTTGSEKSWPNEVNIHKQHSLDFFKFNHSETKKYSLKKIW